MTRKILTKKLAGAEFEITGSEGSFLITTNEQGIAILGNLPNGEYTIKQVKAPTGYLPDNTITTQTLTNQNLVMTVKNVYLDENVGILTPGIIKVTVYERDINGENTGNIIPSVSLRATDKTGNVYYATSNTNGVAYFSGLDVTERYKIETINAPYQYGTGPWIDASLTDIGFEDITTPFYREAIFYLNLAPVNTLSVDVHEKGDARVAIDGSIIEITYPNGEVKQFEVPADGFEISLPRGFNYKIKQISSDDNHLPSSEEYTIFIERHESISIPNALKDVASVKQNITVKKTWGDPKPSNIDHVNIQLLANGEKVSEQITKTDNNGDEVTVFNNVRKYNDNHVMIEYTVKEVEIPNYYAVYTKNDVDGTNWTVTNYEGSITGNCFTGNWWLSSSETAWEYTPAGDETGRSIAFNNIDPTNEYLTLPEKNHIKSKTYGYGIAVTPVPHKGKYYILGMNRYGYVTIHDLSTDEENTFVNSTRKSLLNSVQGVGGTDGYYANTLGFSMDGSKLYAGAYRSLLVFDSEEIINWVLNGGTVPAPEPEQRLTLPSQADYLGGDVIELVDGSLLIAAKTTLYIATKNGSNYNTPVEVGQIDTRQNDIETLAMAYVSGTWKVIVTFLDKTVGTGSASKSYYTNYMLNEMPNASDQNKTYMTTVLGTENTSHQPADAASGTMGDCSAVISVHGQKIWENDTPEDRPDSIKVELLRNGSSLDPENIMTVTPDDNGNWHFSFTELPKFDSKGSRYLYSVREVSSPIGYETINPLENPITSGVANYTIKNILIKNGLLQLKKVDNDGNILPGASFSLYGSKTNNEQTVIDLDNLIQSNVPVDEQLGTLTFDGLSVGTYFLKETVAPVGYELDSTYYKVVVHQSNSPFLSTYVYQGEDSDELLPQDSSGQYLIPNKLIKTCFKLKKVDGDGDPLSGVEFNLSVSTKPSEDGTRYISGNDGIIKIEGLTVGDYVLSETKPIDGYLNSTDNIIFMYQMMGHLLFGSILLMVKSF